MTTPINPAAGPQIEPLLRDQKVAGRTVSATGAAGRSRRWLWLAAGVVGPLALVGTLAAFGTGYRYGEIGAARPAAVEFPSDPAEAAKFVAKERKAATRYTAQLAKATPQETYIVIDALQNRLSLWKGGARTHEAVCSAGSGHVLKETGGRNRQWIFDTPRGAFKVSRRMESPAWSKPDWAFVEEGKPVPANREDRIETGTLGEYALYLEDGYMIHGTLYERLLGRSVSHGCVRLGKNDLRKVWAETKVGTPVFIH